MVTDVVVSGAGPAGSTAARRCAELGLSTVLLEKGTMMRDKCCAGGLLERALRRLDLKIPEDMVEKEITGFAVQMRGGREEFDLGRKVGITVRRSNFDAFLARAASEAGAELRTGVEVQGASEESDAVMVKTSAGELRSRYLIVADGANSRLARYLYGPPLNGAQAMGLASNVRTARDTGNLIEIRFIDTPTRKLRWGDFPVNGWMFPQRSGANVGVAGRGRTGRELQAAVEEIVERLDSRCGPVERTELMAHPLPFKYRRVLHTRRSVIVGDAAGLVNPITGEGMGYAFLAAGIAAMVTRDAIAASDPAVLVRYDEMCRRELLRDLRAASLIGPLLHRLVGVVGTEHLFRNFKRMPELVDVCADIARGEEDWLELARLAAPRFLPLFFSSIGPIRES
jgi:geranylgeranyl reductase family protein